MYPGFKDRGCIGLRVRGYVWFRGYVGLRGCVGFRVRGCVRFRVGAALGKGLVSLCHRQCFTLLLADFDIYSFPIQLTDEIDLRKCYLDVDKKFKGERGIILNLDSWRKLVKAVNYVDRRVKVVVWWRH